MSYRLLQVRTSLWKAPVFALGTPRAPSALEMLPQLLGGQWLLHFEMPFQIWTPKRDAVSLHLNTWVFLLPNQKEAIYFLCGHPRSPLLPFVTTKVFFHTRLTTGCHITLKIDHSIKLLVYDFINSYPISISRGEKKMIALCCKTRDNLWLWKVSERDDVAIVFFPSW